MKESLRIGNIIEEGTIESFFEHGVHVGFGKCHSFNEINPTLITQLSEMGFVNDELDIPNTNITLAYHVNTGMVDMLAKSDHSAFYIPTGITCKYTHEVQNLYYALTGRELIKE